MVKTPIYLEHIRGCTHGSWVHGISHHDTTTLAAWYRVNLPSPVTHRRRRLPGPDTNGRSFITAPALRDLSCRTFISRFLCEIREFLQIMTLTVVEQLSPPFSHNREESGAWSEIMLTGRCAEC